jgi:hypothetical protein
MTEAEFERQQVAGLVDTAPVVEAEPAARTASAAPSRTRNPIRGRGVKLRRVQRMFAIEEELDKKLWLYAIHVGKDRSEVINDLLRPLVASMVLYDSRDRRAARANDSSPDTEGSLDDLTGR